ncbi:hypothetical protein Tco_1494864 [Tanacetum coccineum]
MSSPSAHIVLETITPTNRARNSLVITPLHDEPYMLVRQDYTPIATDIESKPYKDPIETEENQPLPPKATPISPDYTPACPNYTPDTLLLRHHPPLHLLELSITARYRSSYETPSSSASPASSLTLPIWKRCWGTSEPILVTKTEGDESKAEGTDSKSEESKDKGPSSESEETTKETTTPRLPVRATWEDPVDDTVYMDIECVMPPVHEPIQTPASLEWSSGSLLVSLASLIVPSPVASLVTTPAATIVVDEHEFLEVGAQLELHRSILHDHTQRLDALPPTLFEREILALRMQHTADQCEMQELREHVATLERRMDHVER